MSTESQVRRIGILKTVHERTSLCSKSFHPKALIDRLIAETALSQYSNLEELPKLQYRAVAISKLTRNSVGVPQTPVL